MQCDIELVPSQNWKHCPGKQNPADIPSGGMSPRDLESNKIWLNGPEWLAHQLKPATEVHGEAPKECLLEKKKQTHTLATSQVARKGLGQPIKPERFSCLKKLLSHSLGHQVCQNQQRDDSRINHGFGASPDPVAEGSPSEASI